MDPVILAFKNDDCTWINTDILNQIPGEQRIYHSYDKIICDNDNYINSKYERLSNEIEFVEFLKKLVMMKPDNSLSLVKVLSKYLND